MKRLPQWVPSAEAIRTNRWLRWLGPSLHHPRLWHMSRRGIALGVALGFFFGLLVPLAQIPLSAAAAVALRANVPAAVVSTLVTNPVTLGPLYYAAWRLGSSILGDPAEALGVFVAANDERSADASWWEEARRRLLGVGKSLMLGLSIMATAVGVSTYFLVSMAWKLSVLWKRHRRRRSRPATSSTS